MRRGRIAISRHAIDRYIMRFGLEYDIDLAKSRIQNVYDNGKYVKSRNTNTKIYVHDKCAIVVENFTVKTAYCPPYKGNKVWIERQWITV